MQEDAVLACISSQMAIRDGRSIQAAAPIEIVDASAAAGGSATFAAVNGLDGQWSGAYENALVTFTYTPQVALSAGGKKISSDRYRYRGPRECFRYGVRFYFGDRHQQWR
jgi:hypothetical protein